MQKLADTHDDTFAWDKVKASDDDLSLIIRVFSELDPADPEIRHPPAPQFPQACSRSIDQEDICPHGPVSNRERSPECSA